MEVGSTNSFGSPDLDLRPPPMERDTLCYQIQRCPECGYCAPSLDIPIASDNARNCLSSEAYQAQLNNADFPDLANHFCCAALLAEAEGNLSLAAWCCLKAAWACDDSYQDDQARHCRSRAAEYFQQDTSSDDDPDEPGSHEALLTDVLRRSGQFDTAAAVCRQGLAVVENQVIQAVLRYQQSLIQQQEVGCHTIEEAMAALA